MSISIPSLAEDESSAKFASLWQQVGSIVSILAVVGIIILLQMPQLTALKQQKKNASKVELQREEANTKIQLGLMKNLPTLGFKNLIADWHFMGFIQYFGDGEARRQAGYSAAIDYFDVILDRDPRFLYGYYYLSNTASLYAGEPERSVSLLDRGLKVFTPRIPDRGYYIWRLKAVDELLFLGRVADARRSMESAARWARQYPNAEGQNVAQISQNTANYLARNPNSKQAQFDAWNMVLNSAIDEPVIKRAIAEIKAIGGKVKIGAQGELKVEAPMKD